MKEYVRIWRENTPILQRIRDQEIREANTVAAIQMFDEAFKIALRDLPPRESSGLVEWQKMVKRWRSRFVAQKVRVDQDEAGPSRSS
jgi:hypothetical protein